MISFKDPFVLEIPEPEVSKFVPSLYIPEPFEGGSVGLFFRSTTGAVLLVEGAPEIFYSICNAEENTKIWDRLFSFDTVLSAI